MKQEKHANALLLELLIVIFFFMLASTTFIRIFGEARKENIRTEARGVALEKAENISDTLYLTSEYDKVLKEAGFDMDGDAWVLPVEHCKLAACMDETDMVSGKLIRWDIQAIMDDEVLFILPGARYWPEVEQP